MLAGDGLVLFSFGDGEGEDEGEGEGKGKGQTIVSRSWALKTVPNILMAKPSFSNPARTTVVCNKVTRPCSFRPITSLSLLIYSSVMQSSNYDMLALLIL